MLMIDSDKLARQDYKLTPTTSMHQQKHEREKDFENCSLSNFDLLNQKLSQTNIQLPNSDEPLENSDEKPHPLIQIIDLESEESPQPQKLEPKQATDSPVKNPQYCEMSAAESNVQYGQQELPSKQYSVADSEIKYSILNSETLNQRCSKCESTLLCPAPSEPLSKWIQCLECLEMSHFPCEIQSSANELRLPVCIKCSLKKKPLLSNSPKSRKNSDRVAPLKPSKKNEIKRCRTFKDKSESFMYLDAFLNGFSYKLAITDEQVKKEIKLLERKVGATRASEKALKY